MANNTLPVEERRSVQYAAMFTPGEKDELDESYRRYRERVPPGKLVMRHSEWKRAAFMAGATALEQEGA